MIVIIGSGISGLSLSFFLSSNKIENLVIEMRNGIGKENRSTCLLSKKIFKFLPFLKSDLILKEFDTVNIWHDFENSLTFKSKRKMFLLNYLKLEKEIFKNIDRTFSNFIFKERAIDVNLEKNILFTNRRKIKYEILVDASGTHSFLANKFDLFKSKKIYNSFEVLACIEKSPQDINIVFSRKFSKEKFGWIINIDEKSLVGLIDVNLKYEIFQEFLKNFIIKRTIYQYFHPILFCDLKTRVLKNALIIGEASGLIKPFSLGGISYGIISSLLAYNAIKRNDLSYYEKKVKKLFGKAMFFGKLLDSFARRKNLIKIVSFLKLYSFFSNLDPDFIFYTKE